MICLKFNLIRFTYQQQFESLIFEFYMLNHFIFGFIRIFVVLKIELSLLLFLLLFNLMSQILRRKSLHVKNHSFTVDKKSAISTHQTSSTPQKSFNLKLKIRNQNHEGLKTDLISQSIPVQIYFNPSFRNKYAKKLIDSYFPVFQDRDSLKNSEIKQKQLLTNKLSLRSRMNQWKMNKKIISDLEQNYSGQFIRSLPKKSAISDFGEENCLSAIDEKKILQQRSQIQNKVNHNLASSLRSIQLSNSPLFRPFSQHIRKRLNKDVQNNKSVDSVTISIFWNEGTSPRQKMRKQVRKLIYSTLYYEQFSVFEQGNKKQNIRRYLNQNNPLYIREDKISKKGVKILWKSSKHPLTLQYPCIKSLKELLIEEFHYDSSQQNSLTEIYSKPYYHQLFLNNNQQLIDIIHSMTKFIINLKGQILTNAFRVENLFKVNEKQFYLKDLGSSAIFESIKIRDKSIQCLYPPIFKEQSLSGKWLIRPEYLSPQLIRSYRNSDYSWIQQSSDAVMASQVWSLGCMILELITLIPLYADTKYRVKFESSDSKSKQRKGFLSIKFHDTKVDFDLLQKKQKHLQFLINRIIKSQLSKVPLEKKVMNVLVKMLVFDSKNRITPDQILKQLKF